MSTVESQETSGGRMNIDVKLSVLHIDSLPFSKDGIIAARVTI